MGQGWGLEGPLPVFALVSRPLSQQGGSVPPLSLTREMNAESARLLPFSGGEETDRRREAGRELEELMEVHREAELRQTVGAKGAGGTDGMDPVGGHG